MVSWSEITTALLWMVGFNLVLTVILLTVMIKHPKYIVLTLNRFLALKYGLSKKRVHARPNFSYCYYERGQSSNAPSLLLVHGYSSSKDSYLGVLKHLPRRQHVIVMDLPGHAETDMKVEKDDLSIMFFVRSVREFVKAVGLDKKKFHILGTSMGGHIAGMYSIEYPDDVKSVVLSCPHGITFKGQKELVEEAQRTNSFELLPRNLEETRKMFKWLCHKKIEFPDIILSGILELRLEKDDFYRNLGHALVAPDSTDLLERNLHRLTTPCLLLWGREDKVLPVECAEIMLKKMTIPPKRTVIMDNVGHVIFLEQPKKVSDLLVEFFNSLN